MWRCVVKTRFLEFICLGVLLITLERVKGDRCRNNSHVTGSWMLNQAIQKKQYVCKYAPTFAEEDYIMHNGTLNYEYSLGCGCDEKDNKTTTISRREQYEWFPDTCTLPHWDAADFCRVLGNRYIMLAGDSTMHQTTTHLMAMITDQGGACGAQISYAQSHFLIFGSHTNFKLTHQIERFRGRYNRLPDVVIMTVGAHLSDVGDMKMIWESDSGLIKDIKWLRTNPYGPHNFSFVWKTQNPGHVNCTTMTEPLTVKQSGDPVNDPVDIFHWYVYPTFDSMSKKYSADLGMNVIDVSPLYYRGDAHPSVKVLLHEKKAHYDCLHYCQPGPLYLFAVLLYNALLNNEI
jgi:hypothetical protein